MSSRERVDLEAMYLAHTDKAVLVETEDGAETWLPVRYVQNEGYFNAMTRGDVFKFSIPEWLAINEGLV